MTKSERELGLMLREAARDNKNSNCNSVYRAAVFESHLSKEEAFEGAEKLAKVIENILAGSEEFDFQGVMRPFETTAVDGEEFIVVKLEKVVEQEMDGFGAAEDEEEVKEFLPVCLISMATGDVFGADPSGNPDMDEGIRANVREERSLQNCINPKTGLLHLFGATVADLVFGLRVNVDIENDFGETALVQAVQCAHIDLCRWLLVEGKANANHATKAGVTPVIFAADSASENHEEIVRILVKEGGADLNRQNVFGATALHVAAFRGHLKMCEILLELGADKSMKDLKGRVPGDYTHKDTSYIAADGTTYFNEELENLLN